MELTNEIHKFVTFVILCANLIYLTVDYMKYRAITNVAPYYPIMMKIPKISICFDLSSFLKGELGQDYNYSIENSLPPYFNMTFDEMFQMSPFVFDTLVSCKYRDFTSNILIEEKNGTKCTQFFKITKFKMQSYMCYRYEWIENNDYSFHSLVNSLYEPRELYHLNMKNPLADKFIFYPLLHYDDLPDDDRVFNKEGHKTSTRAMFILTLGLYETYSLKSPYETHCVEISKISCYQECVDSIYKMYGYIHDASIVIEGSPEAKFKPVEIGQQIANFSLFSQQIKSYDANIGRKINIFCHSKCPYSLCDYKLVNTHISPSFPSNNNMSLVIETVNRPITKIVFVPLIDFNEYSTQMASLIGIYIGLSFVTLRKILHQKNLDLYSLSYKVKRYTSVINKIICSNVRILPINMDKPQLSKMNSKLATLNSLYIITIRLAVFCVFCWQLINVMQNYFSYSTTIIYQYITNPLVIMPSLTLCFSIDHLFSLKNIENITESNYYDKFTERDFKLNFTLTQLFERTVTTDLIKGCLLRDWNDRFRRFTEFDQAKCLKLLNVKKFFANQKICFLIVPRKLKSNFYQSDIRFLTTNPGMLYAVIISELFFQDEINLITHFTGNVAINSIEYMITAFRKKSKNTFIIANRIYQMKLKEAPYDTYCNKKIGINKCYQNCQTKLLSKFNRIPYSGVEENNSNYTILSFTDLVDQNMYLEWEKIEKTCKIACWQDPCEYSMTLTFLENQLSSKKLEKGKLMFLLGLPSYPRSVITNIEIYKFYDLLYQMMCCLSFWLGFSILDLDPISVFSEKKSKKAKEFLIRKLITLRWIANKISISFNVNHLTKEPKKQLAQLIGDLLVYCLAITCFTIHSVYSMRTYFNYPSDINIYVSLEKQTDIDFFLCLDTTEVIARKMNLKTSFNRLNEKTKILNRTVSSIFNETPKHNEIIEECSHWGLPSKEKIITNVTNRILFTFENRKECQEYFKTGKFVSQNYICYSITPANYSNWDRLNMKNTLNNQKTLYEISVKTSLLTRRYTVIVGRSSFAPFSSINFSPTIIKDPRNSNYLVSYSTYNQTRLPSPYTNDGFTPFLFDKCLNRCVNDKLEEYKLTLSRKFHKPTNLTYISYIHRQNVLAGKFTNEVLEKCEKGCLIYNKLVLTETRKYMYLNAANFKTLKSRKGVETNLTTFHLMSTNHPVLKIVFRMKISVFEQIINIGSIISIWFGLSMMDLAKFRKSRDWIISRTEISNFDELIKLLKRIYKIRYNRNKWTKGKC